MFGISNIERRRREKGLTQAEFASLLGVRQSTVSHIECHKRNPSVPLLLRAASILETTVDDLIGREDDDAVPDNRTGG